MSFQDWFILLRERCIHASIPSRKSYASSLSFSQRNSYSQVWCFPVLFWATFNTLWWICEATPLCCHALFGKNESQKVIHFYSTTQINGQIWRNDFDLKRCRFPFGWKNPFGYLIALTLQYITLMYVFQFIALLVSLGVGVFLLTITMIKDLKRTVRALNKFNRNELLFMKQLYDFIQFHSIAKQLSWLFMWI